MHTVTRSLVKMIRICKIVAVKNILKLKHGVKIIVTAFSRSPKVVHLKVLLSES